MLPKNVPPDLFRSSFSLESEYSRLVGRRIGYLVPSRDIHGVFAAMIHRDYLCYRSRGSRSEYVNSRGAAAEGYRAALLTRVRIKAVKKPLHSINEGDS